MGAAVIDEEAGSRHAAGEADGGDEGGLMDVLLHDVAQEGRRHAKEEDGEAECPFRGALGETDIVGDLLAEDGPTVDSTYAAVKQQRRNRGANPFVVLHDVPRFLLCFFVQHISSGGRQPAM